MKKIVILLFCMLLFEPTQVFAITSEVNVAVDEVKEPWELEIEAARELYNSTNLYIRLNDVKTEVYQMAVEAIQTYLDESEFEHESFLHLIRDVISIANITDRASSSWEIVNLGINIAYQMPREEQSVLVDLWLLMARIRVGVSEVAVRAAIDTALDVYADDPIKIIKTWSLAGDIRGTKEEDLPQALEIYAELEQYIKINHPDNPLYLYYVELGIIETKFTYRDYDALEPMLLALLEKLTNEGSGADKYRYNAYRLLAFIYGQRDELERIVEVIDKIKALNSTELNEPSVRLSNGSTTFPKHSNLTVGNLNYVIIKYSVDEKGVPFDFTAISQTPERVNNALIEGMSTARFLPAFEAGKAVVDNDILYEVVFYRLP